MENCALEQYTTLVLWHPHLRLVFGWGWGRALWAVSQRKWKDILLWTVFWVRAISPELQAGPKLLWSMILPDLTLFPGCLGHCFSGNFAVLAHLDLCVDVRERASKRVWFSWLSEVTWLQFFCVHICKRYKYPHSFREVLLYQATSSWLALFTLFFSWLYLFVFFSLTSYPPLWLPVALSGRG